MRLKENQTQYVATKIGIDLANAPFIKMPKGKDAVVGAIKTLIDENLKSERALDDKVKKILEENDDEIEFQHANERQLFFMIKNHLSDSISDVLPALQAPFLKFLKCKVSCFNCFVHVMKNTPIPSRYI